MLRRVSFRQRHGFTTIEALIASVVFLLGLSGLMGALTQARNSTGQARRYMQATDIANDLVEQIQLWDLSDPRLSATPGVCNDDPLDHAGALLKPKDSGDYKTYTECMHDETELKSTPNPNKSGETMPWGGLQDPVFKDEQSNSTDYKRFYIVRVQDVRPGVKRIQIWVKVRYEDAGEPRVVTTQAMRIQMGS
jgi:type II secretory pathway pseudopilin PulG